MEGCGIQSSEALPLYGEGSWRLPRQKKGLILRWNGLEQNLIIKQVYSKGSGRPGLINLLKLHHIIEKLQNIAKSLDSLAESIDECRGSIMGIEGSGGRIYFSALSSLMPDRFKFTGRSRNPAKDEFNTLLNYSYGVLYSLVEKGCIIAGLDPYVGFIHTDHYNKKSLVFDLIENYRIWADETIINLFASRKIKTEYFDKIPNGFTLNKEGKAVLLTDFNSFMDESIRYRGRNIKRNNIIQFDCHRIANQLIADGS